MVKISPHVMLQSLEGQGDAQVQEGFGRRFGRQRAGNGQDGVGMGGASLLPGSMSGSFPDVHLCVNALDLISIPCLPAPQLTTPFLFALSG